MADTHPSRKILVCFAVPAEAAPFRRWAASHESFTTLVTGMGSTNARNSIRSHLHTHTPHLILSCGFAGGLNSALKTGEVVFEIPDIPAEWPDPEANNGPDMDVILPTDPRQLAELLTQAGAHPALFHCSPRVLVTAQEKTRIHQQTNADAVDMESESLRDVAATHRIPFAIVRVISDAASENLPLDFNQLMTPEHRLQYGRLALKLLLQPALIPKLMAFNATIQKAARNLGCSLMAAFTHPLGTGPNSEG